MPEQHGKPLSVDDLLSQQDVQPLLRATVESTDDPLVVKLTPYVPDVGCLCSGALLIPKAAIENVIPTGEAHICCGKQLSVVEINFVKHASIPVADVLEQLKTRLVSASMKTGGAGGYGAVPSMFEPPQVSHYHQGHKEPRKVRPMSGCFACNQGSCYRKCWDQNGNEYWQYDPVCC